MITVKQFDLEKFASGYFEDKIKKTKACVDSCLNEVELNKRNGNPNPYKGLLNLLKDLYWYTGSDVRDWEEFDLAYCEAMNIHEKVGVHEVRVRSVVYEDDYPETLESFRKTTVVFLDENGIHVCYEDIPEAESGENRI